MERLTRELELAEISPPEVVGVAPSPTDPQRCSVPAATFDRLGLAPGDLLIVRRDRTAFLCRARRFGGSRIEADLSTTVPFDGRAEPLTRLGPERDAPPLAEIEATISAPAPGRDPAGTLRALLTTLALRDRCSTSFEGTPRSARFGIDRALIRFGREDAARSSIGRVVEATEVRIVVEKPDADARPPPTPAGLERELAELIDALTAGDRNPRRFGDFPPSKQILVSGPPGCGKTSLVRLAASRTARALFRISACELDRSEPGEAEAALGALFRRAFSQSRYAGKCVILLDDVDDLRADKGNGGALAKRISIRLSKLLDESQAVPGVAVVATVTKIDNLDPHLRRGRRLETEIHIRPPDEEKRCRIIRQLMTDLNCKLEIPQCEDLITRVAEMTPGYVGADLKSAFQKFSWKFATDENMHLTSDVNGWIEEFRRIISNIVPLSLKEADAIITKAADVQKLYGVDDLRNALDSAILWPLRYPESYARMGIARPKGVLLYGPPGCGKTSSVNALAAAGGFAFLSVSAADLYSPYVGDAERFVVALFRRARMNSPCLVFVDEIDALVGARGDGSEPASEVQTRVLAALLAEMDGVGGGFVDDGVTVIAATNRPEAVDPALMRPGRFDRHLKAGLPDEEARFRILSAFASRAPCGPDVRVRALAVAAEGFSGADLKAAFAEAALLALAEDGPDAPSLRMAHLERAIASKRRSLS